MFNMLSCFNLRSGVSLEDFQSAVETFVEHMQAQSLIVDVSPIGRRCAQTPMDTDDVRDHQFFFTSRFVNKAQCDAAYRYIEAAAPAVASIHGAVMRKVAPDAVFICWDEASPV